MEIKRSDTNCITIKIDDIKAGWEQWVLLRADAHHDSIYCDRIQEKRDLETALARDAIILDFGDLFDAMQGHDDRRRAKVELRPEYNVSNYFDAIVEDACAFYKPYANNWVMLARGNHETSVRDKIETDLTNRLAYAMRTDKHSVLVGGYGGWIRFMFDYGHRQSRNLKYFHGSGGGGPVTKGVIQSNRQAAILDMADIVVNGHVHEAWHLLLKREGITTSGKHYQRAEHHVRTPGYKNAYNDGSEGWEIETGKPPKPVGCVWVRFSYFAESITTDITVSAK